MLTQFIKTLSLPLLMALPLAACGEGEQVPEVSPAQLGQQQAAFSGNWSYSWGDTKTSSVNIGTSVNRTCFLTGIGGNFRPIGAYVYAPTTLPAMAGVRKTSSGDYELYVQPDGGKHLIAYARCVNSSAGRIEVGWNSYQQGYYGDKVIAAANGSRQCFLQDIKNNPEDVRDSNNNIYTYSWALDDKAVTDEVRLINDNSYWKFSIKSGTRPYPVNIQATAVCLDTTEFDGFWSWKAGDTGSAQINLTNVAGATCGLNGISGPFDAAYGDWNDAISITNVGNQFKLNTANGKQGWATCVK